MKRQTITPKDKADWLEMRTADITSTDVAALFGLSPYQTEYELYHRKKDGVVPVFNETDRMRWGNRLEKSIAEGIAEDKNWQVKPFKDYMRLPELKIGSSFDFLIADKAILEIKNVDIMAFKSGWEVDGDDVQAPHHIELQVQNQMLVSGLTEAYIGALIGGNNVVLIRREIDTSITQAIQERVFDFWQKIAKGQAPSPDFRKDASFIQSLYKNVEPGKILDASNDEAVSRLANRYEKLRLQKKEIEELQEATKAEILTIVGDAEKIKGSDFSITAGITAGCHVSFDRAPFRNFRLSLKKQKEGSNE